MRVDFHARVLGHGGVPAKRSPTWNKTLSLVLGLICNLFPKTEWPWFPALITGYRLSAIGARMTRSSLLEVLRDDYVRTARAKGLREQVVVLKHALRTALLPVVTIIGVELLVLFGGLVVVETVFTIPGIGRFLVDAITYRDYPSIQALVFVFAVFVVVVNLLVDIAYAILDPRIRYT